MSKRVEYSNSTVGFLLVGDFKYCKNTHAYWNAYCMFCNSNIIISSQVLGNGSGKCMRCARRKKTYLEARYIAKDYVSGIGVTKLATKNNCSTNAIYSALKLVSR